MRLRLAAVACLIAVGSTSCRRADPDEGAQPAPAVTTFEQGRFDEIPLFPRSEPVGSRSEKDGVVARSYKALGASPEQVLDFYRDTLPSRWRMVAPIEKLGVDTFRADWEDDRYRLRVTATLEPLLRGPNESSNAAVSQYSLSLQPL